MAKASKWIRFLDTITRGDKALQQRLQQMARAIYENPAAARQFSLYGPGANGKTTFLKALGLVLPTRALSEVNVTNVPQPKRPTLLALQHTIPESQRQPMDQVLRELRGESANILAWVQAGAAQAPHN